MLVLFILTILAAAATPFPNGGSASAQSATSAGWTTNASTRPTTVVQGSALTVTTTVRSSTSRSALVYVDLNDGTGNATQVFWDQQTFKAGRTRTFKFSFTVPTTARVGLYTVRVGVFGTNWNGLQHWNGNAASFTVTALATTTTTQAATTTTQAATTTTAPATTTTQPATTTTQPATTTTTAPATTTTQAPSQHFATLPVGAALPSEATCAGRVRPAAEIRTYNAVYNQTKGSAPLPENPRVTGNFTGTTDEIIQWAACKWGIDEDIVRAQIAKETWWRHASGGDLTTDQSRCYPSLRTTDGSPCPESYGLGQVRYPYHTSAMADSIASSAFNLDYTYSVWRSCFEGAQTWLNQFERGKDYVAGDVWGCVGLWFAGRWYTQPANDYIAAVQGYLSQRIWETSPFITFPG